SRQTRYSDYRVSPARSRRADSRPQRPTPRRTPHLIRPKEATRPPCRANLPNMRPFDYIAANLRHHWRMHLAVIAAVAVATAVLTGALLMGESVRGSLRDLTLERLGRIDQALVTQQFFRQKLAEELKATP